MFFCPPYAVEPCGLFTPGHLTLFLITVALIAGGLYFCRNMEATRVRTLLRLATLLLWVLEIAKILFVLLVTESRNPNDFIPLYYCSLILYAGLLSSLGKGVWRKIGDVFIATGGFVGGAAFLICPNTSLPRYPMLHFISLHSFLLHGLMVFLALLLMLRGVYRPQPGDIKHCAGLVSTMCVLAVVFNRIYDATHPQTAVANLMFMSKDFPGTPVTILYHLTGPLFPLFMWLIQAFLPFWGVFAAYRLVKYIKEKKTV